MSETAQPEWLGFDHVQLAMPPGREDDARAFYAGRLGLGEVPKPAALAARGGCWFEAGPVRLHLGVDQDFHPAGRAHPALLVRGLSRLVHAAALAIDWSDDIPGVERGHVEDPFGNRIELIEAGP